MALFQEAIIKKHLNLIDDKIIEQAFSEYKRVYSPDKIKNIRVAKEEQYQEGFIKEIFGSVLGYSVYPESPFNIETEKKNETNARKADGAILRDDKVVGVIELKDNKTKNLDAVKDQAFGYKNNHKDCSYVISSNFHILRFYIDDATDYEEFDLYNLDKETFKRFYLYLRKEGLLDKNLPKLLRQETKFHEEEISKKLYKDYSHFKRSFFENAVQNNQQHDKLELFKKSQKFLDRILFLLFAEDKGLVGTNSIVNIVEKWSGADDDYYLPLYDMVNKYFGHLYRGYTYQKTGEVIPQFGGELFAPDELLESLKIDDAILKNDLLVLSKYDFNTDVDVNILGHIFEHSLNEVDDVEAELRGETLDKTKSKRKKDGVFYTPKYITKYIVDNTLGKLCTEKKIELKLDEDIAIFDYQKADGKLNEKGKELYERLNTYKSWLLTVKVCDPACGSGAFLNQALSYFIEEHKFVDDIIAELTNTPLRLFDTDLQILENNIFGVDINDESVEIAKLSMWLRTAQPGRKLSDLSNNIKCGNSLIDDPAVAGDKSFNWEKEFPTVFEKGGFDVVIGNPPYVLCQPSNTDETTLSFYKSFEVASYKIDLFHLFFEKAIQILTNNGKLGFITPNTYLNNKYIKPLRAYILKHSFINELVNYEDAVFTDAGVDVATLIITKNNEKKNEVISVFKSLNGTNTFVAFKSQVSWQNDEENIFNLNIELDFESNFSNCESLEKFCSVTFGLQTKDKQKFVSEIKKEADWEPCYTGRDISRNFLNESNLFFKNDFKEVKAGGSWDMRIHHAKKIVVRQVGNPEPIFALDNFGYATLNTMYSIVIESEIFDYPYLLAILNSNLIKKYFLSKFADGKQLFPKIKGFQIKSLPIITADTENQKFISDKSMQIQILNKQFYECINKFSSLMHSDFAISKFSKKIELFYLSSWTEFEKELNKNKITLLGVTKEDWFDRFERFKKQALDLKSQIDQTDKEIDRMVYELYGLTEEEIQIVENS
jgi:hypothetical protein